MAALFIPTKIRVGYQERGDTFTGKLAYVIYFDDKGKIRKEKSWSSWCSSKLGSVDLDNKPTNFTLNKGVKRYSGWNGSGRNMVRVYDHRDFEFEITVDNLLGILHHSIVDHSDVKQECVYAWNGTELVLLPTNSVEYQESVKYTAGLSNKLSAKELVVGATYASKSRTGDSYVYLGKHEWASVKWGHWFIDHSKKTIEKGNYGGGSISAERSTVQPGKHVYWNIDGNRFEVIPPSKLSTCVDESIHPELSILLHKYEAFLDSHKHKPATHQALLEIRTKRYEHSYDGFLSVIDHNSNVAIALNLANREYNHRSQRYDNKFRYGPLRDMVRTILTPQSMYNKDILSSPFIVYAPEGVDTTVGNYMSLGDIELIVRSTVQSGTAGDILMVNNGKFWNDTWYATNGGSWYRSSSEYDTLTCEKRSASDIHGIIAMNARGKYSIELSPWATPNRQQIQEFTNKLVDHLIFVAVVKPEEKYVQYRLTFVNVDTLLSLIAQHFPTHIVNTDNLYQPASAE